MTPEERAKQLTYSLGVSDYMPSYVGTVETEIAKAIRAAEQAVHAKYAPLVKAADAMALGYAEYCNKRFVTSSMADVLDKVADYRAARAKLKGENK